MAEWLYEAGIGESRAVLVDDNAIVAAALEVAGTGPRVGSVVPVRLVDRPATGPAKCQDAAGTELLADRLPPTGAGAPLMLRITREAIPERGRVRPARGVACTGAAEDGPDLLARISATGHPVRQCHAHAADALEAAGWSELLEEAASGDIGFPGGMLRMDVARAMTLFDVDGSGAPLPLSIAAAQAVAAALPRHAIGGSVGIDFPGLKAKADRRAVDAALEAALTVDAERTAMNGFGFVQIVLRRARASLPERLAADPVGAALRARLRRLERDPPPPGQPVELPVAQRRLLALHPEWCAELVRRTGRAVSFAGLDLAMAPSVPTLPA